MESGPNFAFKNGPRYRQKNGMQLKFETFTCRVNRMKSQYCLPS